MTRERMVETVAKAIWANGGGIATFGDDHRRLATYAVDAILPQVSTVEELEALPTPSLLRGDDGQVWQRFPSGWDCLSEDGTGGTYASAKVASGGPLTVVWRPES